MLGTSYRSNVWGWPGVGEIDIMENVQGLNTQYATMHCGTAPGGDCNEMDGLSVSAATWAGATDQARRGSGSGHGPGAARLPRRPTAGAG